MKALISGQAGFAFVISGAHVEMIAHHGSSEAVPIAPAAIWYAFDHATDVRELDVESYESVRKVLRRDWECDRALHLSLILLSADEDGEDREAAALHAGELIASEEVLTSLLNRLYFAPLPPSADIDEAIRLATQTSTDLASTLTEIRRNQSKIKRVRDAFEAISPSTFGDKMARQRIEDHVRSTAASRLLVSHDNVVPGTTVLSVLEMLKNIPNARTVVMQWAHNIGVAKLPQTGNVPETELSDLIPEDSGNYYRPTRSYALYQNVNTQKKAIKAAIARGEISLARKFIAELITGQTSQNQDPAYASKSLCDLSQSAKSFRNFSLQLELAEQAAEVCPEDGWGHSQMADAFICLGQPDDARRALERAAEYGEAGYAATGFARILRLQGKLPEALAAFEQAAKNFESEPVAWIGCAEVLREMWKLDEARAVYDKAREKFPNNLMVLAGRANVLKELGLLQEALNAYDAIMHIAEDEPYGCDGRADVLFEMGDLEGALAQYKENIQVFAGDSVAYCGAAESLLAMGREEDAVNMYRDAVARFPYLPIPAGGLANALSILKRFPEAEAAYRDAIERFPDDFVLRNGFANYLKLRGQFQESLREYDRIARLHPFDIVSRTARADLLKQLGQVDDAIAAYEDLRIRNPRNRRVQYSLAAVLVSKGFFDRAEALLPIGHPCAEQEWVAYHIRGMLYLKRGRYGNAERIFRDGVDNCPWWSEREYFRRALTLSLMRQERWQPAARTVERDRGATGSVLRIHILGELGESRAASKSYQRVKDYCPPLLQPLRDELAKRYVLGLGARKPDRWLVEQETNAVLLRAA